MKKNLIILSLIFFICVSAFSGEKVHIFGKFRLKINENAGTFCLYVTDIEKEKYFPVLNPLDNYSGNKFYVKVGRNSYALSKSDGVPAVFSIDNTGASILYSVKKVVDVKVMFSFVNSSTGKMDDADLCIIDVLTKNKTKYERNISVKAIFDTNLGESTVVHFSSKTLNQINNEAVFYSMSQDKWIKSSNRNAAIKFLLDGPTISSPANVAIANYNILSADVWEPRLAPGRGFNSLFSFNDSALAITFKPFSLKPETQSNTRFYISASNENTEPPEVNSKFFSSGLASESLASLKKLEGFVNEPAVEYVILSSDEKNEGKNNGDTFKENGIKIEKNGYEINITPDKLNQEYINSLLDKIAEIEKNPDQYDQKLIFQLNAEIDAVLKILGQ
ncbi:MAG: hypothetical protein ACTTHG_07130 [Treponemataceae bacterium]